MTKQIKISGISVSFVMIITVTMIVLKLIGVIGWPWWCVLFPLWLGFSLAGAMSLGVLLFVIVITTLSFIFNSRK